MRLSIKTHLLYSTTQPCNMILQIEALTDTTQKCHETQLLLDPVSVSHRIAGEDQIGTRRWITAAPMFECHYETKVEVLRAHTIWADLSETPKVQIPSDVIKYLMPSRYCPSDLFLDFVSAQFGTQTGGPLIAAMADWIHGNFTYDPETSLIGTTATDSFACQSGVCRDYAHVLIALARAAGIPARFVSVYAPDVTPQDFHAVAEVFLEGEWHLIDPTRMSTPSVCARICVGRDAADASFMTSYGWIDLREQSVEVTRSLT